ncbi:MAG: glycosyltransferase family 2 protein [Chloroflexia bacterium]
MTELRVAALIVNWNTRDLLTRCLEALYAHPPAAPFETVVVDNASSDGSAEMVRQRFPQVRLIQNEENTGFARACNRGIQHTSAPFLLLLNPDCFLQPGTVDTLLEFLEQHSRVAVAGPRLLDRSGHPQLSAHPFPSLWREFWRLFHLDRIRPLSQYPLSFWQNPMPQQVDIVQGACMLLRRSALPDGQPFDEDFFMYTEEVDLCYRLRRASWEVCWVPEAVAVHLGGESTRQASLEMFLQLYRSKVLFFRKHRGRPAALAYKMLLALAALTRILLAPLLALARPAHCAHLQEVRMRYCYLLRRLTEM